MWTQAALAVEQFRVECSIDDPGQALGDPDQSLPATEWQAFLELNRGLPGIAVRLAQARRAQHGGDGLAADHHATVPPGGADLAGVELRDAVVDPAVLRPDQELRQHLRQRIARRPDDWQAAGQQAAATAGLPDELLAAWWGHLPKPQQDYVTQLPDATLAALWDRTMGRYLRDGPGSLDPGYRGRWDQAGWAAAATYLAEIDRRVTGRVRAVLADPPAYLLDALGPSPDVTAQVEPREREAWDRDVAAIEAYRLLTGTADPARALGPTPPPDSSWQQCWRRELAQDHAAAWRGRMRRQHAVIGTPTERAALDVLASSTVDPWLGVRPAPGMLEESQALTTGVLRRRITAAVPLFADRPANHAGEIRDAQLYQHRLLEVRGEQQLALDTAKARRVLLRLAAGRGVRAARAEVRAAICAYEQAIAYLDDQLVKTHRELARLDNLQAAYYQWTRDHALDVALGQAAAQALQGREIQLLDDLAAYPPAYLLAALGRPPTNRDGLAAWRRGALVIERYRAAYQIDDRDQALGGQDGTETEPGQFMDRERVGELLDDVRRVITNSLARELDGLSVTALDEGPEGQAIQA